jgi:nucleoside-diphosphate-sugar epimerase
MTDSHSHVHNVPMTDVLLLGGTGVLGRAVLPHLRGRTVVATTRSAAKLDDLRAPGVTGAVCDVYDAAAIAELAVRTRPGIVANFLTDLAAGDLEANSRIRREGAPNVVAAARAAGARRLVVESIAFGAGNEAVESLERGALESGLEAVVLRFGLFWGPGTWYAAEPDDGRPSIHVADAGRRAAELLFDASPGVHEVISAVPDERTSDV